MGAIEWFAVAGGAIGLAIVFYRLVRWTWFKVSLRSRSGSLARQQQHLLRLVDRWTRGGVISGVSFQLRCSLCDPEKGSVVQSTLEARRWLRLHHHRDGKPTISMRCEGTVGEKNHPNDRVWGDDSVDVQAGYFTVAHLYTTLERKPSVSGASPQEAKNFCKLNLPFTARDKMAN